MEVRLILRELRYPRPGPFARCTHESEDLLELIIVRGAWKQWSTGVHLCHDTARRPDVDGCVVGATAEKDVRRAVPQCHDLVRERVYWDAEGASETEVCKFELTSSIDQQILGLEISMEHTILVAEVDSSEQLLHEGFDGHGVELATVAARVHVFLQIFVHVFKHEHEFVFGVDYVVEGDDVFVLEFLHQADFADGCTRGPFFAVEVNFFESDKFAGLPVATFEDLAEG